MPITSVSSELSIIDNGPQASTSTTSAIALVRRAWP